jgi:hypothetical protein
MTRTGWLVVATALALAAAAPAAAQEPKVGNDWYEDDLDYGFKVKVPKGWDLTPPTPDEPNKIASYEASNDNDVMVGGQGYFVPIEFTLLRFDNRPKEALTKTIKIDGVSVELTRTPTKDIHAWVKENAYYGVNWHFDQEKYPKALKVGDVQEAKYWVFEGNHPREPEAQVSLLVAEYTLAPDVKIGLLGSGPGDKKWRGYESAWLKLASSFGRIAVEARKVDPTAAMGSPRAKKRAKLEQKVSTQNGWSMLETENFFILTNEDDKQFLDELMGRLEAIRSVYEELYPAEKARAIVKKQTQTASSETGAAEGGDAKDPAKDETVAALDPLEASRMSVLRVCKDRDTYDKYGGPPNSAGYWNWADEELVVFDYQEVLGRNATWTTLNHEAFHQYIYYFYGQMEIHSWYNEGTGDFFGGYQLKHNRFQLDANPKRKTTAQGMVRQGPVVKGETNASGYVPLKDFVKWSKSEYYGSNAYGLDGGYCYAQGWSLIYFLRTGAKKAKGWRPAWDKILDTYLETLVTTGDLDEAVDKAFPFSDEEWEAFENSWKSYTLSV